MCGRIIRCLTHTCCETVGNAITYFACQAPIYACVRAIFNQITGCCINWWHSHNAAHPPAAAAIAHPAVAIPVAHPAEPVLVQVMGASDEHHEGLE